jgi:TP53 regulating kinase-like protein
MVIVFRGGLMKLLKKGAEANIYLDEFNSEKVIVKLRVSKRYRLPIIDSKIREYRTFHEAQLINETKKTGISTPAIIFIDKANFEIIMQYIEGERLKDYLQKIDDDQRIKLCYRIGNMVARLHQKGIIHGDLTTSNMILTPASQIYFIDFGLGFHSKDVEHQGVDLYLLKKAFQSFHFKYAEKCFRSVMQGYRKTVKRKKFLEISEKIKEIEKRGRYIPER